MRAGERFKMNKVGHWVQIPDRIKERLTRVTRDRPFPVRCLALERGRSRSSIPPSTTIEKYWKSMEIDIESIQNATTHTDISLHSIVFRYAFVASYFFFLACCARFPSPFLVGGFPRMYIRDNLFSRQMSKSVLYPYHSLCAILSIVAG